MALLISEPTLLLDQQKCLNNLDVMLAKCQKLGLDFRPHFKTHQSIQIGRWFRERGIHKIATSSLKMAEYFAQDNWTNITVAFPTNILEIDRINRLASKIELNLLIQSVDVLEFLNQKLQFPVNAYIQIDLGYGRTGFRSDEMPTINRIVTAIQQTNKIRWKGFLGHAGHSYSAKNISEIRRVHQQALDQMQIIYDYFSARYSSLEISIGDTPCCSSMSSFGCASELRPGNFIFYDLTQQQIGACSLDQIAVAVACPVVAIHQKRHQIVVYGGGVHFSKEVLHHANYGPCYGLVVATTATGWGKPIPNCYVAKLSQEHGTVQCSEAFMQQIKIGDIIYILPVHSCMTANVLKSMQSLDGQQYTMMP